MKLAPKFAAGTLAVFCAFAALAAAPAAALAQNATIGIVNIQKVFNEIREVKDIKTNFDGKAQQLQAQKQAAEDRVKALVSQRNLFNPGTQEYQNVNNEIVRATTEAQVQIQMAQQDLLNQQKTLTKQVFDKIDAAVKKIAEEKGLTMVISQLSADISPEAFERATPDQLNQILFSRSVLYTNPSADLTSAVITAMDANYASSGPAPTPTPAPNPNPTPAPAPRR